MDGTDIALASTALGQARGVAHDGLVRFRGIPFAEAPVGPRRFAPPVPRGPWREVLDATRHGPVAPQGPSRLVAVMGDFTAAQSEDCLTLTITTPAVDAARRPVIVWLHGGGYSSGAGSLDWYDGGVLAREGDAVVVGVNYRLGPLGFLRVPGRSDGQAGLQDMIAALRWVREHVAGFGGDPGNVTVMGQSAGAAAVMCMLTMPSARALFDRAVLQSPPTGVPPFTAERASAYAARFFAILGCAGLRGDALIERLQAEPAGRLLAAAGELARASATLGSVTPPFFPVLDGFASARDFAVAAAEGAADAGISLVVGTNRDEARAMVAGLAGPEREPLDAYLESAARPGRAELYWRRRAGATPAGVLADAMTDDVFLAHALVFAETAAGRGADVWAYQVDWAPRDSPFGACHCLELPLVFGTEAAWPGAPMLQGADLAELRDLGALMRTAWLAFARAGTPASPLPWPRYDASRRHTMVFDSVSGPAKDPAGADWRL